MYDSSQASSRTRNISIHAPREGSDLCRVILHIARDISIHAPREGSDSLRSSV